jgi:GGDEF domain-containing protein
MPARRPPPLSSLPVAELLAQSERLARRWAIALILARPLQAIGELPLEDLALQAPALCAQVVLALESDGQLETLLGGESAQLAAIAGARQPAELAAAVEALRGVLWEELLAQLGGPAGDGRRAAEAGDRLAFVCACALAAAVGDDGAQPGAARAPAPEPERPPEAVPAAVAHGRDGAVIIDEQPAPEAAPAGAPAAAGPEAPPRPSAAGPLPRPLAVAVAGGGEIAARDQRREEGPAAWIGSVGRELERFALDGRPFAVLLLEVPALARSRPEVPSGGGPSAARVEQALLGELRERPWRVGPPPALTRERPGRYWLIAPRLDRGGAELLAERLVRAVAWTGEQDALELVAGVAVCPDDARDAAGLAAHADIELYAARRAR